MSPVFGKSVRYTDRLRCVRVDDRQFTALGEELPSLVPRQSLSTCVSESFLSLRIPEILILNLSFRWELCRSMTVEETANSSLTCHACSRAFQTTTLSGPGRRSSATNGKLNSNSTGGTGSAAMDTGADGVSPLGRYRCTDCLNDFCTECDVFIHDVLHCCPGCER